MPTKQTGLAIDIAQSLIRDGRVKKRQDGNWYIWHEAKKPKNQKWLLASQETNQLLDIAYLNVIKIRLKEYRAHYNEPYAYFHEEIPAVGELKRNAVDDIEFLLATIDKLKQKA